MGKAPIAELDRAPPVALRTEHRERHEEFHPRRGAQQCCVFVWSDTAGKGAGWGCGTATSREPPVAKRFGIEGEALPDYEPVLDAFLTDFERDAEVGAALCIIRGGVTVVDLWGDEQTKAVASQMVASHEPILLRGPWATATDAVRVN